MHFMSLSRTSTSTVDSRKSMLSTDHGLQLLPNDASHALSPQSTNSGTKAEMMDPEDQAWGSAPAHRYRQRFHLPTFGPHKSSSS